MYYDQKECGLRISKLRYEKNMSQSDVTQRISISIDQLRSIECGRRGPSIDMLVAFAILFDVSLDYLILGRMLHTDTAYIKRDLNKAIAVLEELNCSL